MYTVGIHVSTKLECYNQLKHVNQRTEKYIQQEKNLFDT